ncbi:MAG: phospho-sugar mutase [Firmicutes bacterium]|nr:phospho-sugar mutase [Candidatus Alectryobacillus merdavium]
MTAFERYQQWLDSPRVGEQDKEILRKMSNEDIDDAFYKDIEFGTAGMRGIIGPGTNRINFYTVRKATIGFAQYLLAKFKNARERGVVISHDNRHMSREFVFECAQVLNLMGFRAFIFDSLRPTPELSFGVRFKRACGGIMITASHNPKEYNGYKVYDENGCQLVPKKIEKLLKIINNMPSAIDCDIPLYKNAGEFDILTYKLDETYLDLIKNIQINSNLNKKDFKVVYSPEHGTSFVNAIRIFKECGYHVYPVLSQCAPDPNFTGTLTPNPEDPNAYIEAINYAKKINADLICITDPDGDRVGIAARKRDGEYRIFTGNESGALLMNYIFKERERLGLLSKNGVMYNTIVTSSLGDKIATSYGVKTESFLTGFKYIGDRIQYYEENRGPDFEFGYEESYGCLISPFVRDKDGIQAILLYTEMTLFYKLNGLTLDEQYDRLEQRFGYHTTITHSITFKGSKGHNDMINLIDYIRRNPVEYLCNHKVVKYNDYLNQVSYTDNKVDKINLESSNVLKFIFDDGSSIAIRPSGTEPKCKIYVEAVSTSREKADMYEKALFRDFTLKYNINLNE